MTALREDQRPGLGGRKLTGEQTPQAGLPPLYTENEEVNQRRELHWPFILYSNNPRVRSPLGFFSIM